MERFYTIAHTGLGDRVNLHSLHHTPGMVRDEGRNDTSNSVLVRTLVRRRYGAVFPPRPGNAQRGDGGSIRTIR